MVVRGRTAKTISDPLYGAIPLTQLEIDLINSQAFQRLRRVGQLGLADRVFPSADYSRFAHSIGACHVIGMIMESLCESTDISDFSWQEIRIAMLLHDIGHYPLSHATEKAVEHFYKIKNIRLEGTVVSLEGEIYLDHERIGAEVLTRNKEVGDLLEANSFDPTRIGLIFGGKETSILGNLVKSELDADRLDYLMRSSQATGLPYGHYDRDYIIQNLKLDAEGKVCLDSKALRAADHFLMCRAFDYLQTVFHKTVVGFEQMLQRCVQVCLEKEFIKLADRDIREAIATGSWLEWDDRWLTEIINSLVSDPDNKTSHMATRLKNRMPPSCIWDHEHLESTSDTRKESIRAFLSKVEEDHVLGSRTITWFKSFTPTDVSPSRHGRYGEADPDKERELIRILGRNESSSVPLIRCENSLMKVLGDRRYVFGRIYFVVGEEEKAMVLSRISELATEWNYESDLKGR